MSVMKSIEQFAHDVGGEIVAGCVIATVEGKKQYLYQAGQFTPVGRTMYNEWTHLLAATEPDVAIASEPPKVQRKSNKRVEVNHG
jgi:hypothetical protein